MRTPRPLETDVTTAHAPGRANLMGEHTDYNGGRCLPIALPLAVQATLRWRTDSQVLLNSVGHGQWRGHTSDLVPGGVTGWAAYAAGALAEVAPGRGVQIDLSSTVPSG